MGKPSEPVACLIGFLERYTQLEGEIGLAGSELCFAHIGRY